MRISYPGDDNRALWALVDHTASKHPNQPDGYRDLSQMQDQLDLLELLAAFGRRWRSWLVTSLLVGIAALVLALILPKEYRASAVILPPQGQGGGGYLNLLGAAGLGAGGLEVTALQGREVLTLLNSRALRTGLIEEFDLRNRYRQKTIEGTLQRLRDKLLIEEEVEGGLAATGIVSMKVSVVDKDAQIAADMANWIVDEANHIVTERSMAQASWEAEYLGKRMAAAEQELTQRQKNLAAFSARTGFFALEPQLAALAEDLAAEAGQITALEAQAAMAAAQYGPEHPLRRALEGQIRARRGVLERLKGAGSEGVFPGLESLSHAQMEYFELYLQVEKGARIVEELGARAELAKIQQNFDRPRLRILEQAVAPDYKSKPKRALVILSIVILYQLFWLFWLVTSTWLELLPARAPETHARLLKALHSFRSPSRNA
jgi:uncharacterized protein involved in exopolysaccharide biosynthesis